VTDKTVSKAITRINAITASTLKQSLYLEEYIQ